MKTRGEITFPLTQTEIKTRLYHKRITNLNYMVSLQKLNKIGKNYREHVFGFRLCQSIAHKTSLFFFFFFYHLPGGRTE